MWGRTLQHMPNTNLSAKLASILDTAAFSTLGALAAEAARLHGPLYLVGGSVRDLLLDRLGLDVDFAVQGDAPALAQAVAQTLGLRVTVHPTFQTATLHGDSFSFDIAMTRREVYVRPGALPIVHSADIESDLRRRDFSVNAMALPLAPAGELIDPLGGRRDLTAKRLRVLHERSFQDDATRILRAARYAVRLGLRVERQTLAWLRRDIAFLETISSERLRYELERILQEARPEEALTLLQRWGALGYLHPSLRFGTAEARAFARAQEEDGRPSVELYLALLAHRLSREDASALAERIALPRQQRAVVEASAELRARSRQLLRTNVSAADLAEALDSYPEEAVWALALSRREPDKRLLRYLQGDRHLKPELTGDDLARLGVPVGRRMGELLRRLRRARIEGDVRSRADEEALVRRLVSQAER